MGGSSGSSGSTSTSWKMPGWYSDTLKYSDYNSGGLLGEAGNAYDAVSAITNGLGLTSDQQNALSGLSSLYSSGAASSLGNQGLSYLSTLLGNGGLTSGQSTLANQLLNSSYTDNPAYSQLASIASGANIGQNPYTDQLVSQNNKQLTSAFNDTTVPTLDNSFLASGRQGSNLYANQRNTAEESLADAMSSGATSIYNNAYNTDTANQMSALSGLSSLYQNNIANQLSGSNILQQGITNSGNAINLGSVAGNLSSSDLYNLYNLGTMQTGSAYNNANNYLNFLKNAASNSGTQITTGSGSGSSTATNVLGGAASGAALGGTIGSAIPGVGTLIGAGVGAVAGGLGGAIV